MGLKSSRNSLKWTTEIKPQATELSPQWTNITVTIQIAIQSPQHKRALLRSASLLEVVAQLEESKVIRIHLRKSQLKSRRMIRITKEA